MKIKYVKKGAEPNCACGKESIVVISGGLNCGYCGNNLYLCDSCKNDVTCELMKTYFSGHYEIVYED